MQFTVTNSKFLIIIFLFHFTVFYSAPAKARLVVEPTIPILYQSADRYLYPGTRVAFQAIVTGPGPNRHQGKKGIDISPAGHYITYEGRVLLLIGESGTQCVAQNSNLDYHKWIDDCFNRGIRVVHIWSFVPVRQKQDGSQIEDRWGYVIPDVMPWARKTSGPLAFDQRYQWDLTTFDEGPEGDITHYWPRLRDLCSYAKAKNMLVGITMFTGWSKHDYSWVFHPLNKSNGGHLANKNDAAIIASSGTEVWQEPWSDSWSDAKKTQWVWEQLSKKFIDEVGSLGNVFFVYYEEHSYSEGNMGDHFMKFFKQRKQIWVDWNARRSDVPWVMSIILPKNWARD